MFWKCNPLSLLLKADVIVFDGIISKCTIKRIGNKWYGRIQCVNEKNNTEFEPAEEQKIVIMMQEHPFKAYNKKGIKLKVGFDGDIYE